MTKKQKLKKQIIELIRWTWDLTCPKLYDEETKPFTKPMRIRKEVLSKIDKILE